MKTTMHHSNPLMTFICITFGSISAFFSQLNVEHFKSILTAQDVEKAILNGAIGAVVGYILKIILDKITNYLKK